MFCRKEGLELGCIQPWPWTAVVGDTMTMRAYG